MGRVMFSPTCLPQTVVIDVEPFVRAEEKVIMPDEIDLIANRAFRKARPNGIVTDRKPIAWLRGAQENTSFKYVFTYVEIMPNEEREISL